MLSDRKSADPQSPVTSSDDEHLLPVSEVKEVATSLGHQDAHSSASKVVQEAMATAQVEEEKSISEIMEVMSDKTTLLRRNRSCPQSIQLLISDIMDLLEDTGDHLKNSS